MKVVAEMLLVCDSTIEAKEIADRNTNDVKKALGDIQLIANASGVGCNQFTVMWRDAVKSYYNTEKVSAVMDVTVDNLTPTQAAGQIHQSNYFVV